MQRGRPGPGAPPPFTYTPLRKNTQQIGPTPTGSSGISSFSARGSQRDGEDRLLSRTSLSARPGNATADAGEGGAAQETDGYAVPSAHAAGSSAALPSRAQSTRQSAGGGEGAAAKAQNPLLAAPSNRFVYAKPTIVQQQQQQQQQAMPGGTGGASRLPANHSAPNLAAGTTLVRSESTSSAASLFGLAEDDEELQELFAELDAPSQSAGPAVTVTRTNSEPLVATSVVEKPLAPRPPAARRGLRPAKFDRRVANAAADAKRDTVTTTTRLAEDNTVPQEGQTGEKSPAPPSDSLQKELRELRAAAKTKESQVRLLRDQLKLKDATEVTLKKELLERKKELEQIGAEAGEAAAKAMKHLSTQLEFKEAELRDIVAKQELTVVQLEEEKQRVTELTAKIAAAEKAQAAEAQQAAKKDDRTLQRSHSGMRGSGNAISQGGSGKEVTVGSWAVASLVAGSKQTDIVMQIMQRSQEGLFALLRHLGHQPVAGGAQGANGKANGKERDRKSAAGGGLDPTASSEELVRVVSAISTHSAPCHALLPCLEALILEGEPVIVRHAMQVVRVLVEGCQECRMVLLAGSLQDAPVELVPPTQASVQEDADCLPVQVDELLPHPSFENSRILSAFAVGNYERDSSKKLLGKRRAEVELRARKRVFPQVASEVYILPSLLANLPSYSQQEETLTSILAVFLSLSWSCPVACLTSTFGCLVLEGKVAAILMEGGTNVRRLAVEVLFRLAHSRQMMSKLFMQVREVGNGKLATIDLVVALLKPEEEEEEEEEDGKERGEGRMVLWQKVVSLLSLVLSMAHEGEEAAWKTGEAARNLARLLSHLIRPGTRLEGARLRLVKDVVQLLAVLYPSPRCSLKAHRHVLLSALTRLVKSAGVPMDLKRGVTRLLREAAKPR